MPQPDANRSRSLALLVSLLGQQFEFRFHTRPLDLDLGVRVRYYWLDPCLFRRFKPEPSFAAVRAVVGHWATAMRAADVWGELDQQVHSVAALCYPLVAGEKSLQPK